MKMSGVKSYLASFPYDDRIAQVMKSLPTVRYHKQLQAWEFPVECLAQALDELTFLDSIDLILDQDAADGGGSPLTQDEISKFRLRPFQHQIDGINYGLAKKRWLLLDSMGLGKTAQIT